MLWLKYTKSGRSCTRVHWIDWPSRKLARTSSRNGESLKIWEWQFMHVLVGGIPANDDVSTDVWQYRQSMPLAPACRSWLNWMGWVRGSNARVVHGELCSA